MPTKLIKGQRVLIRTSGAGVHYGILESRQGQETHLLNSRRIWSWNGALSLSEIATTGLNIKNSKISVAVEEAILPTTIEVMVISDTSNLPR